jgi:thioredoxin-dependent peroxiredoxin
MIAPGIGDLAPDFTLPGTGGREYTLSEYRDQRVVLAFYPGDFTPGCTRQMCSYRDNFTDFQRLDAVVLGISPQGVESHESFTAKHGFPFPLLADPEKKVIDAYGVGAPVIGVRRSIFLIGGDGVVQYRHVGLLGMTFRKSKELAAILETM